MNEYMPEGSVTMADVVVITQDGTRLPTHASQLLVNCKALANLPELFQNATRTHPVELTQPFSSYETRIVVDFLTCIYARSGDVPDVAFRLDVIKLAHALDATFLDGVSQKIPYRLQKASVEEINDSIEASTLCGWQHEKLCGISRLVHLLERPVVRDRPYDDDPENVTYTAEMLAARPLEFSTDLLTSAVHLDTLATARKISGICSRETLMLVIQAFASAKRLEDVHNAWDEHVQCYSSVAHNVHNFVVEVQPGDPPSQMTQEDTDFKYANYFHMHPGCSIHEDHNRVKELTIVAVFDVEALRDGVKSRRHALTTGRGRVLVFYIEGALIGPHLAKFTLESREWTETDRISVQHTVVVPGLPGRSFTGQCTFGKDGRVENDDVQGAEVDVQHAGLTLTVVCTVHEIVN